MGKKRGEFREMFRVRFGWTVNNENVAGQPKYKAFQ